MSENTIVLNSQDLLDGELGLRFNMPMYGEYVTGFVIRYQNKVYAYVNQCAHVPVELDWEEGAFFTAQKDYLICATHGAHYLPNTGFCVMGPCKGKSLKPISVIEQDAKIIVDVDSAKKYFSVL
jgi:nitrite reductase/ring-hydroxylating ferredoxin subunit